MVLNEGEINQWAFDTSSGSSDEEYAALESAGAEDFASACQEADLTCEEVRHEKI